MVDVEVEIPRRMEHRGSAYSAGRFIAEVLKAPLCCAAVLGLQGPRDTTVLLYAVFLAESGGAGWLPTACRYRHELNRRE